MRFGLRAIYDRFGGGGGGGGGGGAPTDATYVVGNANGSLSAELVLGTQVIMSGTLAGRPAANTVVAGTLYFATDGGGSAGLGILYRSDAATWDAIAIDKEYADTLYAAISHGHSAADVTSGTLALARGGTSISAASITDLFNQLDPLTTRGDLLVRGASDSQRIAIGAANTFFGSDGTDPSWVAGTDIASLAGFVHMVWQDPGTAYSNSAAATSIISGTKYDIPANSLAAGDVFLMEGWGTYLNNSGGARDITFTWLADAVTLFAGVTSLGGNVVTNHANAREFYTSILCRVRSIGGSGVIDCMGIYWLGDINSALIGTLVGTTTGAKFMARTNTAATVDTTQALTIDLKTTLSAATATQTVTAKGLHITKHNAI